MMKRMNPERQQRRSEQTRISVGELVGDHCRDRSSLREDRGRDPGGVADDDSTLSATWHSSGCRRCGEAPSLAGSSSRRNRWRNATAASGWWTCALAKRSHFCGSTTRCTKCSPCKCWSACGFRTGSGRPETADQSYDLPASRSARYARSPASPDAGKASPRSTVVALLN